MVSFLYLALSYYVQHDQFFCTFSFTLTERSTLESSFFALVILDTPFLAATSNQFMADLGFFWECGPMGSYSPSVLIQPQLHGERRAGCGRSVWPQTWPPWKAALLTCCSRASQCGRNSQHRRFLCKELLPGLVDICTGAGAVIN